MKSLCLSAVLALLLAPASSSQRTVVRDTSPDPSGAPSGHDFIPDLHHGGTASAVRLLDVRWGRLVDVHALLPGGRVDPVPAFADFVASEVIQSDGSNYRLETVPLVWKTRLVILRERTAPDFGVLLAQAEANLPLIIPKHEFTSAPPFSFAARNAALVLRFDDLLADGAVSNLADLLRIRTGSPPSVPFGARVLFDRNHGGTDAGVFHSTRVIIDLTVSELESAQSSTPLPLNLIGLPASPTANPGASVSIRIPTQVDLGTGQYAVLTNLAGNPLSFTKNGPNEPGSPTLDIVRALRAGNQQDPNNGFLLDLEPPEVLGRFAIDVIAVRLHPHSLAEGDFLLRFSFEGPCQTRPRAGDLLQLGTSVLEVQSTGAYAGGTARVRARLVSPGPLPPAEFLGRGLFVTRFDPMLALDRACWVTFFPQPRDPPAAGVDTSSGVSVHYSEPLDPASLRAFEALRVVRGDSSVLPEASNIVAGEYVRADSAISFVPLVPYPHVGSAADPYHVELSGDSGPTDLAGNQLGTVPSPIDFTLDPQPLPGRTGGFVLRFADVDEVRDGAAEGHPDLRGQFFYDFDAGVLGARPVAFTSFPVDRTGALPGIMVPFAPGVREPFNPLGSKLQAVWRYADCGFNVRDETKYNLDVAGLNWSPIGGNVINDFFPGFEIRLAHSFKLPDERLNGFLLPAYPNSGLFGAPHMFSENVLDDPAGPQKIVHPRALGYFISVADLFVSTTGTSMVPYPLNRGAGPLVTYTWRDTAIQAQAGPNGAGIPQSIEVGAPLFVDPGPAGSVAPSGAVPSIGLPLLMEFRCYPTDQGLGLNALDISLAINSSAQPSFRAFSAGGVNTSGQPVVKNPDTQVVPTGGFNPGSTPPGRPSPGVDNSVYIGQLDVVTRVSRAHTIWLDSGSIAPEYVGPVLVADLPGATQVRVDFRGADGFAGAGSAPFDAGALDAYGDLDQGTVLFHGGVAAWTSDLAQLDGARFVQARLTFVNDVDAGTRPTLDALALAFVADPLSLLAREHAR